MISTRTKLRRLALALLVLTSAALPGRAHASFTLLLTETAGNVVVNGSGTINTTALTLGNSGPNGTYIRPSTGLFVVGPSPFANVSIYSGGGLLGPTNFGTGTLTSESSGTGNIVGVNGFLPAILVPQGYVSGTSLTDSATYTGQTFASLGFTPGTYTYTWGTGANADSLVVTSVASVVPEPSTWALLGIGAVGLGLTLRRQRRARLA